MKYKLLSIDEVLLFETDTDYLIENCEDAYYSASEFFFDILFDIFDSVPLRNDIDLNLDIITNYYFDYVRDFIRAKYKETILLSVQTTDCGIVLNRIELPLIDVLNFAVRVEEEDSSSYVRVGEYIESFIEDFCGRSQWHIGINNNDGSILKLADTDISYADVAWFGPINEPPNKKWLIKNNSITESVFECTDYWEIIEYLVDDCNDAFLIWYTMECAFWCPDTAEILKDCPISVDKY